MTLIPINCPRYYRNDDTPQEPLHACHEDEKSVIPACEMCKGKRTLEFQVMSTILVNLGREDLDFGTLIVYSCDANCHIKDDGFAEEVVLLQQFSRDGMAKWGEE